MSSINAQESNRVEKFEMTVAALKAKIRQGGLIAMINPSHPSPSLAGFVARSGADLVFIDCEHGVASHERVQEMCRAVRVEGAVSLIRPDVNEPWSIGRYLDAGADGIMAPHIETRADAERFIEAVKAAKAGTTAGTVMIALVESVDARNHIPAIAALPDIDAFLVGPSDLSYSMGLYGQPHREEVRAMVRAIIADIRQAGKHAGTVVSMETVQMFREAGATILYEHANNLLAPSIRSFRDRAGLS